MIARGWLLAITVAVTISLVLLLLYRTKLGELFHTHVADRPKRRAVLAAIGFFVTFAVARVMAYGAYREVGPFQYVYVGQTHIHHLVWGILLLLAVGFCWLLEVGSGGRRSSLLASRLMALLYGVGAALTLDEFALWLNLEEGIYWTRRDLISLDAVILFGAALLVVIWGKDFLKAVGVHAWESRPRRRKHKKSNHRHA